MLTGAFTFSAFCGRIKLLRKVNSECSVGIKITIVTFSCLIERKFVHDFI